MSDPPRLKLHLELGDTKVDLEGDPDQVTRELLTHLAEIYPTLDIARKLTYAPDLIKLSEALTGIVEFAPEGIILNRRELSAEQAILVCLLGSYVGYRLGKCESDSMSALGLSRVSGKALKTISNQIALMVDEGLVDRVGRSEYRVTSLGIKRAEAVAGGLR